MSRFRRSNNKPEAELTPQENDRIRQLIATRNFISMDIQKSQISYEAVVNMIQDTLRAFAYNHKMDLNKDYILKGEFPHFFIERKPKKPFKRDKQPVIDKAITESEEKPAESILEGPDDGSVKEKISQKKAIEQV